MPTITDLDGKIVWTIAAFDLAVPPEELKPRSSLDGLDLAGKPGSRDEIDPDRGKGVLEALGALKDPADATEDELKGVNQARAEVKTTLTPLPTLTSVAAARTKLTVVESEIDAATKAVAARFQAERERREGLLTAAAAKADKAQGAARGQLKEDREYAGVDAGKALQEEWDKLEKASQTAREEARKALDPHGPVEAFGKALEAVDGEVAPAETFAAKVKTARTDAVTARGEVKKKWDDTIEKTAARGLAAAKYNLDHAGPSKPLVDNENAIAKERFGLAAMQKEPGWDAAAKQADFDALVVRIEQSVKIHENLVVEAHKGGAPGEIKKIRETGFTLAGYDDVSASLASVPGRQKYFDELVARVKEGQTAKDMVAVAEPLRVLAKELSAAKEFGAKFKPLVDGDVARVKAESAPSHEKQITELVAAIATQAETDIGKATARLPELEELVKTVDTFNTKLATLDGEVTRVKAESAPGRGKLLTELVSVITTEAETDVKKATDRLTELAGLVKTVDTFNKKLATLTDGDYKKAATEGDAAHKKSLTEKLDAVVNVASDDAKLSGAEGLFTTLKSTVTTVLGEADAFRKLVATVQLTFAKAVETGRVKRPTLDQAKDEAVSLRTTSFSEGTAALKALETKALAIPNLSKRYSEYNSAIINLDKAIDAKLRTRGETELKTVADAFEALQLDKVEAALNTAKVTNTLITQQKAALSKVGGVSNAARPDQAESIKRATDALRADPSLEAAEQLEKLLADVGAVTPLINKAEKLHQQMLSDLKEEERKRLTAHYDAGVKAAKELDFETAKKEFALAAPDSLLAARYDKKLKEIEPAHNKYLTEATSKGLGLARLTNGMKKAVNAASSRNYAKAFKELGKLETVHAIYKVKIEEAIYVAALAAFDLLFEPIKTSAHVNFQNPLFIWRGKAVSLADGKQITDYHAAVAKLTEYKTNLTTIGEYATLTKTVYPSYITRSKSSVPGDIQKVKDAYDLASKNALTDPPTALADLKKLETLLTQATTDYKNYSRSIATARKDIHDNRPAGASSIATAAPGTKLKDGKLSAADVAKMVPNTYPNVFTDGKLAGGFKYNVVVAGRTYRIHGHGPDSNAPAGSNSNSGGNVVRIRRANGDGTFSFLSSDGTWDSSAGANKSDATHIPLV